MKRSEAKHFLPIIKAWSEGKTLQLWDSAGKVWMDCNIDPNFTSKPEHYRIKPEPREVKGWAVFPKNGGTPYVLNTCDCSDPRNNKYVSFIISEDE